MQINPNLSDIIIKMISAQTFDQAWQELQKGAQLLELKVANYGFGYWPHYEERPHLLEYEQQFVSISNFSNEFTRFYEDGNFVEFDTTIDWAIKHNRSALWSEIDYPIISGDLTGKYSELYHTTRDFGMKTGAMIPFKDNPALSIAGMTIVTDSELSDAQGDRLLSERLKTMEVLANIFHSSRPLRDKSLEHFKLTNQEQEVLYRFCKGERTKIIGMNMGKYYGRVEKQIANVKRKLHAATIPEAVTKALLFELIDPLICNPA